MRFEKKHIKPWVTTSNRWLEGVTNGAVRRWDSTMERVALGGRKANYDDTRYEFIGGPGETLRRKHYDRSLRLLWKAQEHSPHLSFRDCSNSENDLLQMALRSLTPEEEEARTRIGMPEYRELLNREYTLREKQAIVNVLSAIGHGEAYAWLVSADLLNEVKSTGARAALTMQVMEEAKHFVVLRELLMAFDVPVPRQSAWEYLFLESVHKAPKLEKFFGMNVVVEGIALSLFGMMSHLPGLEVLRLFHLDESRHTGLPLNYFREFPMTRWQKHNPRARARRLRIILPALMLLPHLEADLAELGIDAFDFGGSTLKKISLLAERAGFFLPLPRPQLLALLNQCFNLYCNATRDAHAFAIFTGAETTRGKAERETERGIFGALGLA
jgi:hypothetical protein